MGHELAVGAAIVTVSILASTAFVIGALLLGPEIADHYDRRLQSF